MDLIVTVHKYFIRGVLSPYACPKFIQYIALWYSVNRHYNFHSQNTEQERWRNHPLLSPFPSSSGSHSIWYIVGAHQLLIELNWMPWEYLNIWIALGKNYQIKAFPLVRVCKPHVFWERRNWYFNSSVTVFGTGLVVKYLGFLCFSKQFSLLRTSCVLANDLNGNFL